MNNDIPACQGWLPRLWAMLRLRCPRCFRGRVFRTLVGMNDPCPVCGQILQREEGYFLGAMYISYTLGCGIVAAAYFATVALWPDANPLLVCLAIFAGYLPLMPLLFRYSRVIWLHLDYLVCASDTAATSYEKMRRKIPPSRP